MIELLLGKEGAQVLITEEVVIAAVTPSSNPTTIVRIKSIKRIICRLNPAFKLWAITDCVRATLRVHSSTTSLGSCLILAKHDTTRHDTTLLTASPDTVSCSVWDRNGYSGLFWKRICSSHLYPYAKALPQQS